MTSQIRELSNNLGGLLGKVLEDGNKLIIEPTQEGGFTIHCESYLKDKPFNFNKNKRPRLSTFGLYGENNEIEELDEDEDELEHELEDEDDENIEYNDKTLFTILNSKTDKYENITNENLDELYEKTFYLNFYKCNNGNEARENNAISYIGKKVAFPSAFEIQRGIIPKPGETWEVSIAGENPSKTVFFVNLLHKVN